VDVGAEFYVSVMPTEDGIARAEEDMRVMDRPGTAADIAPVVAFLLSDLSGWIRGTNIPVDGGMSSHLLCNLHGL
jgi:NAD(P)-dependent dehydrogenase (short-subunit alcohol dehydrogenase family)